MERRTMRAARIREPGTVVIEEAPIPVPSVSQVRLSIEGTGVCASNLGPWCGLPWLRYPLAPGEGGHEAWGRVDEVGPGVDRRWLGKRVAALSGHAFAEYDVADVDSLVELPSSFDGRPFPAEPFACAMNIFRRSDIREGQWVAIIGIGFLGAILVRLAKRAGARVIAISRRPFARSLATRMGADVTIAFESHQTILDEVRAVTEGLMCERTIECVGAQWPLDLAGELTREQGRLMIAGYHQDGPRTVNMQLWNWRGLDVINAHERAVAAYVRGMREAIERVEDGTIDPAVLLTHTMPLERLGEALDAVAARPDGFVKAVVVP